MNKNDLRYIKTEKIIKESFKKCVEKHGFEKVTVSMICEEGLISRNAFYLHFTDKYDLLDRLFDEFRAALIKSFGKDIVNAVAKMNVSDSTEQYLDAVLENKDSFLFLKKCSRERMEKIIREIIIEMPIKSIVSEYDIISDNIKVQLNIHYMFSAMVAYTELWLENLDKISKEDAVNELFHLCETPTRLFLKNFNMI